MMLSKSFIALVFLALTTSVNANAAIAGLARQACESPPLPQISEPSTYYEMRISMFPLSLLYEEDIANF